MSCCRHWVGAVGLSVCVLAADGASARTGAGRPRVLAKISLEQRTKSPTFYQRSPLRLMNRGQLLYVGGGMWHEQETLHFVRLADQQRISRRVPLAAYLRATPEILPAGARPIHKHMTVRKLLFYDPENGEAALEVSDEQTRPAQGLRLGQVRRHFHLHWDLERDRITEATLVARTRPGVTFSNLIPIGYDASQRTFYYLRDLGQTQRDALRVVTVVGFVRGKPRVVAQFETRRAIQRKAYLDEQHHRALVAEYAEKGQDRQPRGHLVDLATGKVQSFAIPLTTYGAAFDPSDPKRLYAYSAQTGMLWAIDLARGETIKRLKVGTLGHDLGWVARSRLLLLRNSGLQLIHTPRLRKGRFTPSRALYPGFSHVGGSLVSAGRAVIKNGTDLYIVAVAP